MDQPGPSPQFKFVKRHRVLQREYALFEIDEYKGGEQFMLFAHLRFWKFSLAIMKAVLSDWRLFREVVTATPLFAKCPTEEEEGRPVDVEKWKRFVSLLGFKPISDDLYLNHPDLK